MQYFIRNAMFATDSQEEKSAVNGDGFMMNLSKNQKDHYGLQFGDDESEAPNILGNLKKLNQNLQNRLL